MRLSLAAKGFVAALGLLQGVAAAAAQDTAGKPLTIQLNKILDSATGCGLTFVAKNETSVDLTKTSYEMAVFDADGEVSQLLVLAFNGLSPNKTRVFGYQVPNLPCAKISRILVNTSRECSANGANSPVCVDALKTESRTKIEFNQ